MFSRTLTLAAAVVAISSLAYAQSSSNPSMQPNPGGATKAETPGPKAKAKGPKKQADPPSQSSSTPSMAPTAGAGTTGRIEAENKGAKVKGKKKNPAPGDSSSTPAMAPTK